MEITREKIRQLSELYCFELTDQEVDAVLERFKSVEHDLLILNQVDTEGIEPMIYPFEEVTSYLRSDVVASELTIDQVLQNAPKHEDDYFIVPKVVD